MNVEMPGVRLEIESENYYFRLKLINIFADLYFQNSKFASGK